MYALDNKGIPATGLKGDQLGLIYKVFFVWLWFSILTWIVQVGQLFKAGPPVVEVVVVLVSI